MERILYIWLLTIISISGYSAGELIVYGGRPSGMGFCSVTGSDPWSAGNNPAGMAFTSGFQAGLSAENRFLLPDLASGSAAFLFSGRPGAFGFQAGLFGNRLYSEVKITAGYARKFGRKFSAGVTFDYLRIQQDMDYGSLNAVSFTVGLMFRPDRKWAVGFHILNPVPVSLTSDKSVKLPITFRAGVSKVFFDKAEVSVETEKTLGTKASVRAGIEFQAHKRCFLRAGYQSQPQTITAGLGLVFGGARIDLAAGWQPLMGFSPQASVQYGFGRMNQQGRTTTSR